MVQVELVLTNAPQGAVPTNYVSRKPPAATLALNKLALLCVLLLLLHCAAQMTASCTCNCSSATDEATTATVQQQQTLSGSACWQQPEALTGCQDRDRPPATTAAHMKQMTWCRSNNSVDSVASALAGQAGWLARPGSTQSLRAEWLAGPALRAKALLGVQRQMGTKV